MSKQQDRWAKYEVQPQSSDKWSAYEVTDQPTDRTTMDALIEQRFPKAQYPEIPEGEMSRIEKLQAIQADRYDPPRSASVGIPWRGMNMPMITPDRGMADTALRYSGIPGLIDVAKGGVKGALSTMSNLSNAAQKYIPGASAVESLWNGPEVSTTPSNTAQSIGFGGEKIAEFMVPQTAVSKMAAGASLAARMAAQYGTGQMVGLAQGQTAPESVVSGLGGAFGELIQPAFQAASKGTRSLVNKVGGWLKPETVLDPAEAAAVAAADKAHVNMNLYTRTGNPSVGAGQAITEKLPRIGVAKEKARDLQVAQLRDWGRKLADKVARGGARTKVEAGRGIEEGLGNTIDGLREAANDAYANVDELANLFAEDVVVGYGPGAMEAGLGLSVPIMEKMAAPVQIAGLKNSLRGILKSAEGLIGAAEAERNPGLKAVRDLVNGPDAVPIKTAMENLSAIQNIGRASDAAQLRSVSQGIAATVTPQLRAAIDKTAEKIGASGALRLARELTTTKFEAGKFLNSLSKEPVRLIDFLTSGGDRSLESLTQAKKFVPGEIPHVGRATIEGILSDATKTGGFAGPKAFNAWNHLGDGTKAILFPAERVKELDDFFKFAEMASKVIKPSESGKIVSFLAAGKLLVRNPIMGTAVIVNAPKAAEFLYGPAGAKWIKTGMMVDANAPNAVPTYRAIMAKLARLGGVTASMPQEQQQ